MSCELVGGTSVFEDAAFIFGVEDIHLQIHLV
jgi:hypothetical protein